MKVATLRSARKPAHRVLRSSIKDRVVDKMIFQVSRGARPPAQTTNGAEVDREVARHIGKLTQRKVLTTHPQTL